MSNNLFTQFVGLQRYEFTARELAKVSQEFADRSESWLRIKYVERTDCFPVDLLFMDRTDLLIMHADISPIDR